MWWATCKDWDTELYDCFWGKMYCFCSVESYGEYILFVWTSKPIDWCWSLSPWVALTVSLYFDPHIDSVLYQWVVIMRSQLGGAMVHLCIVNINEPANQVMYFTWSASLPMYPQVCLTSFILGHCCNHNAAPYVKLPVEGWSLQSLPGQTREFDMCSFHSYSLIPEKRDWYYSIPHSKQTLYFSI